MPTVTTPGRALVAGPAVGLLVVVGLLSGCGEPVKNPYALPEYNAKATGAPASGSPAPRTAADDGPAVTRVATPSPGVHYTPADVLGQGAWIEPGRIVARTPAQRAVVQAMEKYLSVRLQLANTWTVDEAALAETATGYALTSAQAWAGDQRELKRRTVGRLTVNVSAVQVAGDRATVTGCHFDATSELDQNGRVMVSPPGGILLTLQLRRVNNTWLAFDWPKKPLPACDWRKR
jgi:hypothetical protein